RVLPAAARPFRLQGLSEARARRARQRRHCRILRAPELDRRLARDGHREDREDLPGGRRLRRPLCVRLRLQAQAGGLAALAGPAQERGDAAAQASRRRVREGCMTAARGAGLASHPASHILNGVFFT
ncbi:hypothetical protein, partial [Bradyrhizobium pachyrhizi]|uniref:hypothetical protein n=1 Tax=Bradyrhizobium pachyrhizi TaxID=280333 RepID=UPI003D310D65